MSGFECKGGWVTVAWPSWPLKAKNFSPRIFFYYHRVTLTSQINDRGRLLIFEEKGPEVGLIEERSFIVFAENFP